MARQLRVEQGQATVAQVRKVTDGALARRELDSPLDEMHALAAQEAPVVLAGDVQHHQPAEPHQGRMLVDFERDFRLDLLVGTEKAYAVILGRGEHLVRDFEPWLSLLDHRTKDAHVAPDRVRPNRSAWPGARASREPASERAAAPDTSLSPP